MDWKNYPTKENMQYLLSYYKYKYQDIDIDIIMATDDVALEFVLKNRGVIFSNAPVVFCGVNQSGVAGITPGYTNLTGILEEVDPTDTVNMALSINPSIKDIYILFDNSESGVSSGKIVAEKIESMDMGLNTIPLNNLSYDELIRNVGSYDENSIILVTTYYSDVNGKIIEFEYASREISRNSSVPVYHLYELGLNNGALGGVMISGKLQGENAAKLAVRILDGENPDSISIVSPETTRKVIDYQQLKRFNNSLDKIPEDCEIINKPFSFLRNIKCLYQEYYPLLSF
ncbi:MAG: ABC transporter substrate-binding protein [Acetivibrionales bacterium]